MYIQRIENEGTDLLSVMSEASENLGQLFEGMDSLVSEAYEIYMDAQDALSNIQMESLVEQHFAFMELSEATNAVSTLHKSSKTVGGQAETTGDAESTLKDKVKDKAEKAGAAVTRNLQKLAQWIRDQIAKIKAFIAKFTDGFTEGYKLAQTNIVQATKLYHDKKNAGTDVLKDYSRESHSYYGANIDVQKDGDKEVSELTSMLKGQALTVKGESALGHAQKLAVMCSKFYGNAKRGFNQTDSLYQKLGSKASKSNITDEEKSAINAELAEVKKEQKVAAAFLGATKGALSEARAISSDVIRLAKGGSTKEAEAK